MRKSTTKLLLGTAILFASTSAAAQTAPVSLRDSFPIGNGSGTLCQVQNRSNDSAITTIFDRSWSIVCRDSALPVGQVFALRGDRSTITSRLAEKRAEKTSCIGVPAVPSSGATQTNCKIKNANVDYLILETRQGKTHYVVEGLAAYRDALDLAMRSVMDDKIADGSIKVATTSIEDPVAFARVQAATLDPDQALAEGYRRNNSGDYAEAAEFFETLEQRAEASGAAVKTVKEIEDAKNDRTEYLINRALQKSNLGEFAVADSLFSEARQNAATSMVVERLQRNFEAIHLLNQGRIGDAKKRLEAPMRSAVETSQALKNQLEITRPISARINSRNGSTSLLGFTDEQKLSEEERAQIIDAQARHLLGSVSRLSGNYPAARKAQIEGLQQAIAVRDGRVTSIIRLRAQILTELALVEESTGKFGDAERLFRGALELLSVQYPEARSVNAARAQLAAFLLRRGNETEAMTQYRTVIQTSIGKRSALTGLANQIAPYFDLLVTKIDANPELANDLFQASQILVRPGVAETQAILARELSGGTDEAAGLFRQSTNLARDIERQRIRFLSLGRMEQNAQTTRVRAELADEIARLENDQQVAQARLSEFPQYNVVASRSMSLETLQQNLKPGEAFVKMGAIGNRIFMIYIDQQSTAAYRAEIGDRELGRQVDGLRETISTLQDGNNVTFPFDVERARALYKQLFEPIAEKIASANHLIFEPDGAMLRLPVNLLIADDASVSRYLAKMEQPDADPFDFTGIAWLGRATTVSTAVSARAFTDARAAPASSASQEYLGMGQNLPIFGDAKFSGTRGAGNRGSNSCQWSLNEWNKPISDAELTRARSKIGQSNASILTGVEFTDERIKSLDNLSNYRILHFATHGLVTPPRAECPAKPALLTSFGQNDSDGLLSFNEIFDLKLDADVVILSACDTAGKASITATREAGVTTGGGTALDGLVRSFIGAGGRSVLASHWPAPDDFQATERLIGGLFDAKNGQSIGGAMRDAQKTLMDDAITSHPYYWAGFAIIGDGLRPLLTGKSGNQDGDNVAD